MEILQNIKLSNEEKDILKRHLKIALSLVAVVGISTLILGYLSSRPIVAAVGSLIASFAIGCNFTIMMVEQNAHLRKLRQPIIVQLEEIIVALNKAQDVIEPAREELKKVTATTLDSASFASLNFLSLERLIKALEVRLEEIHSCLYSNNETKIYYASKLLKKDLIFDTSSSKHLIEHFMPDMPASTWIDSLHFLSSRVGEDIKNVKERESATFQAVKRD